MAIYLDYAAATPMDPRVRQVMEPYLSDIFYNPSSSYLAAKKVRQDLEEARARVAHWLGAKPREIIFTAGATESVSLAINGVMRKYPGSEVLVSNTEHDAVLATAGQYDYNIIPVKKDGVLNLEALKKLITDKTTLVSVSYVNNEIGTIQNLKDIAEILQEVRNLRRLKNNNLPIYLHSDASQAYCLDLHVSRLGVDLLTINGAKMYGPKQTGALFIKSGISLSPLHIGGGQEQNLRSGTENVPGYIGMAAALDLCQMDRKEELTHLNLMRHEFINRILQALPQTKINGSPKKQLPSIIHLSWPNVDGERLLMMLDEAGIMVSTGAACAANKNAKSHVLAAIGLEPNLAQGSLRISIGKPTTAEQITEAASKIIQAIPECQSS